MQSSLQQTQLNKYLRSTISFSEKITSQNQTCEHSRVDNHQGLTYTFGYPIIDDAEVSEHSAKSNKKSEIRPQLQNSRHSNRSKASLLYHDKSKYQQLQMILKNQNTNLKQQNELLLQEVYRLKTGNKKYKEACQQKKIELDEIVQECKAQKKRGDDLMTTMMAKIRILQEKLKNKEQNQSQCSLLDILNQAQE